MRHLYRTLLQTIGLAASLTLGQAARADVIFTDFGPSDGVAAGGFVIGTAVDVSGTRLNGLTHAEAFVSGSNFSVTQIDLAIGNVSGTNGATVKLLTDNAGALGTELGSFPVSNLPGGKSDSVTTITGISGIEVTAGDSYFLEVVATDGTTEDIWRNSPVKVGAAFDVLGTPSVAVPEPTSFALLGTGLVSLALRRRRRCS